MSFSARFLNLNFGGPPPTAPKQLSPQTSFAVSGELQSRCMALEKELEKVKSSLQLEQAEKNEAQGLLAAAQAHLHVHQTASRVAFNEAQERFQEELEAATAMSSSLSAATTALGVSPTGFSSVSSVGVSPVAVSPEGISPGSISPGRGGLSPGRGSRASEEDTERALDEVRIAAERAEVATALAEAELRSTLQTMQREHEARAMRR